MLILLRLFFLPSRPTVQGVQYLGQAVTDADQALPVRVLRVGQGLVGLGYMPEYVAEANKALADAEHPDLERLVGIGDRLAEVLDVLDRWAAGQEKKPEDDKQ